MNGNGSSKSEARGTSGRIRRGLEDRVGWWDRLLDRPLLWALLTILGCVLLVLPRTGSGPPGWQPGEVATFDFVVPADVSVPDEAATEAAREEARAAVLPVYDLEPRLQVELEEQLRMLFVICRDRRGRDGEGLASPRAITELVLTEPMLKVFDAAACSGELERVLTDIVSGVLRAGIVDDRRALERRGELGVTLRNLASGSERLVPLAVLAEAVDLRTGLEEVLRAELLERPVVARRWIKPTVEFLVANLAPNLLFNRGETSQRMRDAAERVVSRSRELRRGQVLVRRGDTVSEEVAETLRALGRERTEVGRLIRASGVALLVSLMVLAWWPLLRQLGGQAEMRRRLSMIFILLLLFTAITRLGSYLAHASAFSAQGSALSAVEVYLWALPFAAGPATVIVLLGMAPASSFAVCGAGIAGMMLDDSFPMAAFALASGLVAALATQRSRDRMSMSRVGLVVGAANVVMMLVLELYRGLPEQPSAVAFAALFAFVGGPLSVGVVSFLLPVLEAVFGVTTDTRLLELSNQNLPLLKRLSLEAPGTYQHSLAVSNLAEAGADAVAANALLCRVCAYYHDVGKLVKPDYFVENQRDGNPHDGLAPSMSALVLQSHVKEGLALAREARLPLPVRQGIATHHGTKLIQYFYSRAVERGGGDKSDVRESDYRYPGPKPHTKELGILMLADAVEAAARTLESPTPTKIQAMIDTIFSNSLEDGQLEVCELTFSELERVASAFLLVLTNMYHHRIDYPGFDFNRRRRTRESGPHQVAAKTIPADG
ncbi:MAG: HDIG domain-containing protein [Thermoanaerobaculales bacterium]|nr:HDIG domain-containing protein [Thermoanaerobaculales bacterium]